MTWENFIPASLCCLIEVRDKFVGQKYFFKTRTDVYSFIWTRLHLDLSFNFCQRTFCLLPILQTQHKHSKVLFSASLTLIYFVTRSWILAYPFGFIANPLNRRKKIFFLSFPRRFSFCPRLTHGCPHINVFHNFLSLSKHWRAYSIENWKKFSKRFRISCRRLVCVWF